jgi:hypothetical protein
MFMPMENRKPKFEIGISAIEFHQRTDNAVGAVVSLLTGINYMEEKQNAQ